jgi:hypothetical protein
MPTPFPPMFPTPLSPEPFKLTAYPTPEYPAVFQIPTIALTPLSPAALPANLPTPPSAFERDPAAPSATPQSADAPFPCLLCSAAKSGKVPTYGPGSVDTSAPSSAKVDAPDTSWWNRDRSLMELNAADVENTAPKGTTETPQR